jgi:hypothetical protein
MMEAPSTSATLVNLHQCTRRYNPEDGHLRTHRRENLKSYLDVRQPGLVNTVIELTYGLNKRRQIPWLLKWLLAFQEWYRLAAVRGPGIWNAALSPPLHTPTRAAFVFEGYVTKPQKLHTKIGERLVCVNRTWKRVSKHSPLMFQVSVLKIAWFGWV